MTILPQQQISNDYKKIDSILPLFSAILQHKWQLITQTVISSHNLETISSKFTNIQNQKTRARMIRVAIGCSYKQQQNDHIFSEDQNMQNHYIHSFNFFLLRVAIGWLLGAALFLLRVLIAGLSGAADMIFDLQFQFQFLFRNMAALSLIASFRNMEVELVQFQISYLLDLEVVFDDGSRAVSVFSCTWKWRYCTFNCLI